MDRNPWKVSKVCRPPRHINLAEICRNEVLKLLFMVSLAYVYWTLVWQSSSQQHFVSCSLEQSYWKRILWRSKWMCWWTEKKKSCEASKESISTLKQSSVNFPTLGMYKKASVMGKDIYVEIDELRKAFAIPGHPDSKQASWFCL